MLETLTLDKPEQLKALGHPLRVRALELLSHSDRPLTNRELAEQLGVDPGHLHFHVRMLLKAGLIELLPGEGREKPYAAVARDLKVHPDLLASGGAADVQAAFLEDVGRALRKYAGTGLFRSVQGTLRHDPQTVVDAMNEMIARLLATEDPDKEQIVLTFFASPPPDALT